MELKKLTHIHNFFSGYTGFQLWLRPESGTLQIRL